MTRNLLRPVLLAFLLLFGSSLVYYSLATAQDDPAPAPADIVVAPADEAPTDVPASTLPEPVTDEVPTAPAAPIEIAPEPDKVRDPALTRLLNVLIDVLAAVLLILVPYFAHRLLAYFEKKSGLELSPYVKDKINALLDKGLAFAEEQAHKVLKSRRAKLTMSEKLEFGAGYIMDIADKADAKNWTIDKVKKMLEARLNETRGRKDSDQTEGVTLSDPNTEGFGTVPA